MGKGNQYQFSIFPDYFPDFLNVVGILSFMGKGKGITLLCKVDEARPENYKLYLT